jgi:hypothetical protein
MPRVFGESAQMMAFFEQRSGVPYQERVYAQALVARTAVRRWRPRVARRQTIGTIVYQKGAYVLPRTA